VLDVNTNPANPVIGTRAFSDDPEIVARCGVAAINGLRRAGTLSMAKHFPGHGATSIDSHRGLPVVRRSREQMWAVDLLPFRTAIEAGVDSICTAHVVYSELDDSGLPATLSYNILTGLLRQQLNFEGALFADALVMDAISKKDSANIPAAALKAVRAGVDCAMLLGSLSQQRRTFEVLLAAAQDGTLPAARLDEAVARIQVLRQKVTLPAPGLSGAWPAMNHYNAAEEVAQAAVTLLRDTAGLMPLNGSHIGLVEFIGGVTSPVEGLPNEPLGASMLAMLLRQRRRGIKFLALSSSAEDAAGVLENFMDGCDTLIVATRSAILDPGQMALLGRIAVQQGPRVIHLALRNPYDMAVESSISTVLLTYSDQPAAIAAAVGALCGDFRPTGNLPVGLTNAVQTN
jgi:beta-N-acetylhexosaminidase